jgi:hypothetical protein
MPLRYLKKTQIDVVAKVSGGNGTTITIPLNDLVVANEIISGTPKVDLTGVTFTGHYLTVLTVTRNNQVLLTLPATGASFLNLSGQDLPSDISNNTSNLVVSITGGQGECWLRLKKVGGYESIEPVSGGSGLWDSLSDFWDNPVLVWGA